MSDTTITITPEERAAWRKRVDGLRKELRSAYADGNNRVYALTEENARLLTALEATEAENARLRAERDWLAWSLAEDGCPYLAFWADFEGDMRPDWCICTDTADDGFDCTGDPKECWQQEAASRAVAESEVRE